MKLFRSRAEKELDGIIFELKQYLANNYKDQAHMMREKLHDEKKLPDELFRNYERLYESFTEDMKNYNHREFYKS